MDEPLSSLDAKLRADLRVELKRIQEQLGATILYVTHDQTEAMTLASRIGVIDRRPPRADRHAARDLREPASTAYVATRLGSPGINLLPGSLRSGHPRARTGPRRIGARTEHVRIAQAQSQRRTPRWHRAPSSWVEHLGDQNHLHIALRRSDFVTLSDPDSGLERGDAVAIEFVRPLFFDASGARIRDAARTWHEQWTPTPKTG